ncbi:MinD/ParA family protein [Desulfotruncus alcoholivorax]|uniref:MinD/ParA family protein n=1 Tax=Desulfotruncus alcoholivorax TaxID=265477 RepID=UPI000403B23B|nr:MinD/ParA family protein [Desulfotruncus alcoholivorax]
MRIFKRNTFKQFGDPPFEAPTPSAGPGARIIAVTSGKGGVGKTNISVNLAIALAQLGQRVIVFDADLGLANVEILLGIAPAVTLYDHIFNNRAMEKILFPGPGGIKIIPGGSGFLELANLTAEQHSRLVNGLEQLDRMADFVIIDTGAGIAKEVLAFCASADDVLVVVTPEPTSLTDAYGLIKVLDKFNLHRDVYFVVNQSNNESETSDTAYRLKTVVDKYLNIKANYLGDIVYDKFVIKSVKNQKPFILANPYSPASEAVKKIALSLLNRELPAAEERGLRGFISKLSRLFR